MYHTLYQIQRVELEASQATVTELESHMKNVTDEKTILSGELLTITKELGELKIKTNRVGFATLLGVAICASLLASSHLHHFTSILVLYHLSLFLFHRFFSHFCSKHTAKRNTLMLNVFLCVVCVT